MKTIIFTLSILFGLILRLNAQVVFDNGFESWTGNVPDGWVGSSTTLEPDSIQMYSSSVHSGTSACRLINREHSTKNFSSASLPIEQSATYLVSYWVRGTGLITASLCGNYIMGADGAIDTTGWVKLSASVNIYTETGSELVFSIRNTDAGKDDIQIDDITITKVSALLDSNNISVNVNPDGTLISFNAPQGSGHSTIYESNLWIGGFDASSQLHYAGMMCYTSFSFDYFYGPVANDYNSASYCDRYNRVWKVSKSDIDNHGVTTFDCRHTNSLIS